MSSKKSRRKSVSVPEQITRKRDRENVRGLKINNDLRLIYGYGPPLCLLILVVAILVLVGLHIGGVISLTSLVALVIVSAIGSCAKLVAAIAKLVLGNSS